MAITTPAQIVSALATNNSRLVIDKASVANSAVGQIFSLWRATGQPGQAVIPAAVAAVPTKDTLGALNFENQILPSESYFGWMSIYSNNNAMGIECHDRVAHIGGLSLSVATPQLLTGFDLLTLPIPASRIGNPNYGELQCFLSLYLDGGATASNATVNVTYNNGTTGNLNVIAAGGTLRAGREIALTPFIPLAGQGLSIRGVNSVTLSVSTGTAGNFGFTFRRPRWMFAMSVFNVPNERDWAQLGLAGVPNDACLELMLSCSATTTGALRGQGKIIHG
ncbi:MAG: hypothetical protein DDT39_00002 [Firmicutes bacterium]|nr:hypothetical protein [candidate division NPL-UPA2 bacterium]